MNRAVKYFAAAMAAIVMSAVIAPLQTRGAAAVKAWTSDIVSEDRAAAGELKPIVLVGARNGSFSGKIVLESTEAITGIRASVSALSSGSGSIPASNLQVRYGKAWESQRGNWPRGADILLESPPEELVHGGKGLGAVWVTVNVPADAKPGNYAGQLTVQAQGLSPVKVPVKLEVIGWTLPDPQEYRTWIDFIQSPDTLALEYKTPLWSERHFELIGQSMRRLSGSGSRVIYIPLICQTNLGNEQSMVRWISRGDGRYEYDYSVMEKYLDVAEKNLGKPKLVVFQVWDICQSLNSLNRGLWGGETETRKQREELLGKGARVTVLDGKSKEASVVILPRYEDAASKALWKPMFAEVKKRMKARGLEKTMMLGLMPDLWPNKEEVAFWNDVSGNLPWVIHGHAGGRNDGVPGNKSVHQIAELGYAAYVYALVFNVNPDKGRMYGWQNPALMSNYFRGGALNSASLIDIRLFPTFNITGGQRGGGRMGGDTWKVLVNKRGERSGYAYTRYPENNWRNLDLSDWFLAPGPSGPVATARLESLREGLQECEARIYLEERLLDPARKAKMGDELAARCQAALDEHHRAMWKTVWTNEEDLKFLGKIGTGRNPPEGVWQALAEAKRLPDSLLKEGGTGRRAYDFWSGEARKMRADESRKGEEWFRQNWQEREKALFVLAGEVSVKLGGK